MYECMQSSVELCSFCRVHTTKSNPIDNHRLVTFGAITDTRNVSIYIHIMDKNTTSHLWINHRMGVGGWRVGGCGELLISEITESVTHFPVPHQTKQFFFFFITSHLSFEYHGIYYTNTISTQITANYWSHKTTLYENTFFCCCFLQMSPMTLKILLNAVSKVGCPLIFDPTTCYLVD